MKKLSLLLLLTCFALALPAHAQMRLGFIGGLNLAKASTTPDLDPELSNRTGFGVGGVLNVRLANNLGLELQPMYLQKGAEQSGSFSIDGTVAEGTIETEVNYLEIPALLKFDLSSGLTKPYLIAGPTVGFLLNAKQTGSLTVDETEVLEIDEDIEDVTKSTDVGVAFGAGVSFPAGSNSIFLEGRYAMGLTNINEDPDDPDTEINTRGIQFMAGITFPIGY